MTHMSVYLSDTPFSWITLFINDRDKMIHIIHNFLIVHLMDVWLTRIKHLGCGRGRITIMVNRNQH